MWSRICLSFRFHLNYIKTSILILKQKLTQQSDGQSDSFVFEIEFRVKKVPNLTICRDKKKCHDECDERQRLTISMKKDRKNWIGKLSAESVSQIRVTRSYEWAICEYIRLLLTVMLYIVAHVNVLILFWMHVISADLKIKTASNTKYGIYKANPNRNRIVYWLIEKLPKK